MAKLTFRRVNHVMHRYYVVASLPVVGGVLFLFGSLFFVPEAASHRSHIIGATCFIIGSVCYLIAPVMDFCELQVNLENLADQAPPSRSRDSHFEVLYKSQLLQMQRATTILYSVAGVCFIVGSILFYPSRYSTMWYTHGDWLFISGCLLSGVGATLALLTALELRKTADDAAPGVDERSVGAEQAVEIGAAAGAAPAGAPPPPSLLRRMCCCTLSDEAAQLVEMICVLASLTPLPSPPA